MSVLGQILLEGLAPAHPFGEHQRPSRERIDKRAQAVQRVLGAPLDRQRRQRRDD